MGKLQYNKLSILHSMISTELSSDVLVVKEAKPMNNDGSSRTARSEGSSARRFTLCFHKSVPSWETKRDTKDMVRGLICVVVVVIVVIVASRI
jgi:hypothetical protein